MNLKTILVPFAISFLTIGLAELGDKTQLLSIGFAARYSIRSVIAGVAVATSLLMLVAVLLGKVITSVIPFNYVQLLAAIAFIAFGIWIILSKQEGEEKLSNKKSPFCTVFGGFFLAELGDKTQLATIALVATYNAPIQVWLGATVGMVLVNILGIAVGNRLQSWLPPKIIKYIAAALFIVFGLIALWGALW